MPVILVDNIYIFNCPHCNQTVTVKKTQLNCRIFRHGIYKHNFKQIDPHAPKDICDKLYKENKIYGCGKPFKFFKKPYPHVKICDYI